TARYDRRDRKGPTADRRKIEMTQMFTAERVLEYPGGYTRSVGPVIGRFLTGLRDARILGVRRADGRVLVPPAEYDPATSAPIAADGDHWVEVGPRGTV